MEVPILAAGTGGPMVLVSNGSTDPGLTKARGSGEPPKYYPTGVRNVARVVTTDDVQGRLPPSLAGGDLKITEGFVLDDTQLYGRHIARSFIDAARAAGMTVVGTAQSDRTATGYRGLSAEAAVDGAHAVFLGGTVANSGVQVVKDKVAALGDNEAVKLLAADGCLGSAQLAALPQAPGNYLTFPGPSLARIRLDGGPGSESLDAYQLRYRADPADPADPYALYGVAAAQVIVEAIRRPDRTRAGVRDALFEGDGVTVPKSVSVLGANTRIDPATGDVSIKDVTVDRIRRSAEDFETVVSVS